MKEDSPVNHTNSNGSRQAAWLSSGIETLVSDRPWISDPDRRPIEKDFDFDVVIVGSGYGGSIAAAELSGCTDEAMRRLSVCVLERGKEYLAGTFPSRQADLAGHVRFATPDATRQRGVHDGLYDIRSSEDAVTLVASGLGGGSLINAGVMEMPKDEVFLEARWPQAIRDEKDLGGLANRLRVHLGAHRLPNSLARGLKKTSQLENLAQGQDTHLTRITVATACGPNNANVVLNKCLMCGDCATGCNNGAKDSLDLNLLVLAARAGALIVTGATVLRVSANDGGEQGWVLHVNHTDNHLRDRQPIPFQIRAKRVILAAGTLGSTEILLRSRNFLRFSAQLGRKFSANGDMLVTAYGLTQPVNAVADETEPPVHRAIGPTITAMIDLRRGDPESDLVIQDLAVPGPLRRLFEEMTTSFDVLNQLAAPDWKRHGPDRPKLDDAAINPDAIRNSLVLAMIGRDDAEGELGFGDRPVCDDADGLLTVRWPKLRMDRRFDNHHRRLGEMMKKARIGGRVANNLFWRPFSELLERLFGRQRGPLVTVHPLGGCAMGDDVRQGVTDHCGRVFNAAGPGKTSVHPGLVVLDGSIVPTSLGINPSLTIAVLAFRAIAQLKAEWKVTGGQLTWSTGKSEPKSRPVYATPSIIADPKPTLIELTEQVRGELELGTQDAHSKHQVELTLTTEQAKVSDLTAYRPQSLRGFRIAPGKAKLTILKTGERFDPVSDQVNADQIALEAEVSGELRMFRRGTSSPWLRTPRALLAWFCNRGLRDMVQASAEWIQERLRLRPKFDQPEPKLPLHCRLWQFFWGILVLCSRAGAVRLIEYDLRIEKVLPRPGSDPSILDASKFEGQPIRAVKRLTYARAASPFAQLLEMSVEAFPEMWQPNVRERPVLELNKRYLARQQVPLLRIVDQQDGIAALADMLSFALYFVRVVVQNHALSFRRPDAPHVQAAQRLPGRAPSLPIPEIEWLTVDHRANPPVRIRLTRYNGASRNAVAHETARPVLLIHGYSASGTTFAHPEVPGNMAQTLCEAKRDVWVLDMRCSAGLPTATGNWPFEIMASQDIPLAIEHVSDAYPKKDKAPARVDIVAHCMGAAMFSMAVLGGDRRQKRLHKRIGRVVFSQVGPVMMLSRTNVLAAYILRYARRFVSSDDYEFSPRGEVSLAGQILDRALAAMKMHRDEYDRENPFPWPTATPWVGTRHRMDALYGRTFSLKNMSGEVLARLDDFFGPISIETVSQVIHFAAYNTVTDRGGINRYVTPARLSERFDFPVMSIHGEDNGLVDVATLALMRNTLERAGVPHLNAMFRNALSADETDPVTRSQTAEEIEQLIDRSVTALGTGRPSYLTWRIAEHGHQDCLIGKHVQKICGVISKYLAAPDNVAIPPDWNLARTSNLSSPYQAIAPAFGVRVRIFSKAARIRIQACDAAGRGSPLAALIVPVREQGGRLIMHWPDGSSAMPTNHESVRRAGICVGTPLPRRKRKQGIGSPYLFEVAFRSWPSHASSVLVLLLYDQADGIGGNARPPGRMMNAADQAKSPIARTVTEALTYDGLDDLRGGLIHGSLTEQRPSDRVTFALASCLYPNDILNHMPAAEDAVRGPADASLLALSKLLGKPDSPTLLLLPGDQIYADATAGLFDPKIQDERYRIPHERRGESRGSKAVMQRLDLDVHMMPDDHEIRDNWAPNDPEPEQPHSGRTALQRGRAAYFLYERASRNVHANLWQRVTHRGVPFFLADARTEREPRMAADWPDANAKIMHARQFKELCKWLVAPRFKSSPKFVMTASALLPRRLATRQCAGALLSDAWDGYPSSMEALLRFACDHQIEGLVFLSGDEHLSSVLTAHVSCRETGKRCTFHSIHSSSLFAPYPFANGSPEDFIANDIFEFKSRDGRKYECKADTQFFPDDGFALLTVQKSTVQKSVAKWCLDVSFHSEAGPKPGGSVRLPLLQVPREGDAEDLGADHRI